MSKVAGVLTVTEFEQQPEALKDATAICLWCVSARLSVKWSWNRRAHTYQHLSPVTSVTRTHLSICQQVSGWRLF